jgi:hypothetical protein
MNQLPLFVPTYFLGIILQKKVTIAFFNIYVDIFFRVASIMRINSILRKMEPR